MKVLSKPLPCGWRSWFTVLALAWTTLCTFASAEPGQGPLLGKPAPPFQVRGIYHESYTLDTFKGRILILQFGASW